MSTGASKRETLQSPYPRRVSLGSESLRPKPKPLGLRIAADLWTLTIGLFYGVITLYPHWSLILLVVIGFSWRAFRTERAELDFAPRALGLMFLGWFAVSFAFRDVNAIIDILRSPIYVPYEDGEFSQDSLRISWWHWMPLLALWVGAVVHRKLNREGLDPGGFYEALRSGVNFATVPMVLSLLLPPSITQAISPEVLALMIVMICGLIALAKWRLTWERVAFLVITTAVLLTSFNVFANFAKLEDPVKMTDSIAAGLVLLAIVVPLAILTRRAKKQTNDFELPELTTEPENPDSIKAQENEAHS